jgi:hypothetical protein
MGFARCMLRVVWASPLYAARCMGFARCVSCAFVWASPVVCCALYWLRRCKLRVVWASPLYAARCMGFALCKLCVVLASPL